MTWDFSTPPEYQKQLEWADAFVRNKIEPLDLVYPHLQWTPPTPEIRKVIDPLKAEVRAHGLWAAHLTPELGGGGRGQLELALLNEILGRTFWAPVIFGTQAPDTGNAEILAHYGTPEQRDMYLRPLLDGEMFSCYSMTEPQAGSDPGEFTCRATRDGDGWVLDGYKFFSSNAPTASLFIVLAVTAPELPLKQRMSMFLVPADTPGVVMERRSGTFGEPMDAGTHPLMHYDHVRLPGDALLGSEGEGFVVAQTRLGGGRVHHAMRTVGLCRRAFDMMCERVLSRHTKGSLLAEKGSVQEMIADSWSQITQFRLMVLYTAWLIDRQSTAGTRTEIAAIKVAAPKVLHDVVMNAIQLHGALGISNELPLWEWMQQVFVVGFSDGPAEIHRTTMARQILRAYEPSPGVWPSEHLPARLAAAEAAIAEAVAAS